MSIEITSRSNTKIVDWQKNKLNGYVFEGEKLVNDLFSRPLKPDILIHLPEFELKEEWAANMPKEHWIVNRKVMEKISDLHTCPKVMAFLHCLDNPINWEKERVVVALDSVQDPGNIGTIFRCAAAFGFPAIALAGMCVRPNHPKVIRAAQTALLDLSFTTYSRMEDVIGQAQSHGFHVYLTSPHTTSDSQDLERVRFPALLVFGSEGRGISPELLGRFPAITIRQKKTIESLNVGIAAAILLHELGKASKR